MGRGFIYSMYFDSRDGQVYLHENPSEKPMRVPENRLIKLTDGEMCQEVGLTGLKAFTKSHYGEILRPDDRIECYYTDVRNVKN